MMSTLRRAALLLALPLALVACGDSSTSTKPESATASTSAPAREFGIPASQPATVEAARLAAKGFDAGNKMSARTVFVFFDPQCPHCGAFWREAKKLEKDAHFVWVPVALLNKKSMDQAVALLTGAEPAKLMDDHEAKLEAKLGGIEVTGELDPMVKASITKNTRLLASFGAEGVPYLVSTTADGKPYTSNGMAAEALAVALGWRTAPAAQAHSMTPAPQAAAAGAPAR